MLAPARDLQDATTFLSRRELERPSSAPSVYLCHRLSLTVALSGGNDCGLKVPRLRRRYRRRMGLFHEGLRDDVFARRTEIPAERGFRRSLGRQARCSIDSSSALHRSYASR